MPDVATEGLTVDTEAETEHTQAMFTVVIGGESQSAVMKTATALLKVVEGYGDAETPDEDSDGTRDDSGGESGPESDGTSEPGYTVHDDGTVRIVFDGDRHGVTISPDTRTYQVLYHIYHFCGEHGEQFTSAELVDRYDHMDPASVTPSLSSLQRAGFIEKTGTDGDGAPVYRIEDKGMAYVQTHGEPTKYRLPE